MKNNDLLIEQAENLHDVNNRLAVAQLSLSMLTTDQTDSSEASNLVCQAKDAITESAELVKESSRINQDVRNL